MSIFASLNRSFTPAALLVVTLALVPAARAADAGACARSMDRQTFSYRTPEFKDRDPRHSLPVEMSVEQRRALHPVLWPSGFSARTSVVRWLDNRNFECVEEAFADLEATQARFPDGSMKVVFFLGAARDFVQRQGGMTEEEIAEYMSAWRKSHPKSVIAELIEPRLVMAAAWAVRGSDYARNVPPERMREFTRLNAVAMRQVRALSPAARQHILGHYVGLRALTDNGATREEISRFALAALQRFPADTGIAFIAGDRMWPRWGGSDSEFEEFAVKAMEAVGPSLASRVYAVLYVEEGNLSELHRHPLARKPIIKAGLTQLAVLGTFEAIETLQTFACTVHDAEALRQAQGLWETYGSQPQLVGPRIELDAPCRQWERTLPPPVIDRKASDLAARAVPRPMGPHPLTANPSMYRVAEGPWQRLITPVGEVFSCTGCEYPVEVLIAIGPPLGAKLQPATNERFLATLQSSEDRERAARSHIESVAQLDPASGHYELRIDKTSIGKIAGVKAFSYQSTLRLGQRTRRGTAWELIHKGAMVRVSVHRADGPVGRKESEAVRAFIAGIRLVGP